MIETKKICDDPLIIQHKVYSFPNPQEVSIPPAKNKRPANAQTGGHYLNRPRQ